MPGTCGLISSGFALDCNDPIISGVEDDVLLANLTDVAAIIQDVNNPTLVTGITMKTGAQFYRIEGRNESAEPLYTLVIARYSRTYDHQITFKIFGNAAAQKGLVDVYKDSCIIALIKNKDGVWELYGRRLGMRQSEGTRNPLDADSGGAHNVVIKTSENASREPNIPAQFLVTDAATTEAAIVTLLTPAP